VRLGYFNLRAGRQYLAQTVELEPTSGYLPDSVATRIRAAIGARGGLQPNPWIVHYGDG
jgi:hypothetical protein